MRRFALLWVLVVGGCSQTPPTTPEPQLIYDVGWLSLTRDHHTASSYTNHRVRVRLEPEEYKIEAGEIRVWANDKNTLPILVFRKIEGLLDKPKPITISGTCRGPVTDFVWRTRYANFYVVVENCVVTAR